MSKSQQLQIRVTPAQKAALRRLAGRAGLDMSSYVLARALPPANARFRKLVGALAQEAERRYTLAELHDLLAGLAPAEFHTAVAEADLEGLSPFARNYVAAMVEQVAGLKGKVPPPWAGRVKPLDEPYFAVPFPRLRAHLLRSSPVAFKRRNLFVDSTVGDRV